MNFEEALSEINQQNPMPKGKPSLDKIQKAIHSRFPDIAKFKDQVFLVAGTNGKGSVAKSLETIFLKEGDNIGLYTSPHLIDINERIRQNGNFIKDEDFLKAYKSIRPLCQKYQLTHFEILSLLAMEYFYPYLNKGSKLILEVGMGGRWDATNAIPHQYCILCPIGYDHQEYLGKTLVEIAKNKFDIIQPGCEVFSVLHEDEIDEELKEKVKKEKARLHIMNSEFSNHFQLKKDKEQIIYSLEYKNKRYVLGLPGRRGYENSLFSLFIFSKLKNNWQKAIPYLKDVNWPHRFSSRYSEYFGKEVYFSADHNPQGLASLLEILSDFPKKNWHILSAITKGRDPNDMFDPLYKKENIQLTLSQSPFRSQTKEDYMNWKNWKNWNGFYSENIEDCLSYIKKHHGKDEILITGSLYLSGYVDKILR